ncbi:hypothetical protein NDU88_002932 [Pleurodeles waltl]|uniref:Uncharacterized protein n=1 Tax=Pleurodeles waltl TaxID=8319 RepID=A0AAV7UYJ7_PLEWA|nr:hypothetical protein NDU88_002932 [Pleurodeles waltl]
MARSGLPLAAVIQVKCARSVLTSERADACEQLALMKNERLPFTFTSTKKKGNLFESVVSADAKKFAIISGRLENENIEKMRLDGSYVSIAAP